jgi:hypothetical protein
MGNEKFFLDTSEYIDLEFFKTDRNARSVS